MLVDAYKNNNSTSKNYGQVYPRVFKRDGLNLKGFAKHISEHGSLVKYDLAVLVLQNIVECLKEMMIQGVPVKLDGLGIFSPGIQGTGVNTLEQFDPQSQVKGIRINFRPESAGDEDDKLSKKALKKLSKKLRLRRRLQSRLRVPRAKKARRAKSANRLTLNEL